MRGWHSWPATKPPPQASAVAARVVADIGGPYQRAALVLAGANDGITPGAVAIGPDDAVVGRVTEVGPTSARVLLLTDPSGRIPGTAGDERRDRDRRRYADRSAPELLYLPRDAAPQEGERVVTSGHGGVFPAGLPVGTARLEDDGRVTVLPAAAPETLDVLRLVDFRVTAPALPTAVPTAAPGALRSKTRR